MRYRLPLHQQCAEQQGMISRRLRMESEQLRARVLARAPARSSEVQDSAQAEHLNEQAPKP
jgi:hypothetical protein